MKIPVNVLVERSRLNGSPSHCHKSDYQSLRINLTGFSFQTTVYPFSVLVLQLYIEMLPSADRQVPGVPSTKPSANAGLPTIDCAEARALLGVGQLFI